MTMVLTGFAPLLSVSRIICLPHLCTMSVSDLISCSRSSGSLGWYTRFFGDLKMISKCCFKTTTTYIGVLRGFMTFSGSHIETTDPLNVLRYSSHCATRIVCCSWVSVSSLDGANLWGMMISCTHLWSIGSCEQKAQPSRDNCLELSVSLILSLSFQCSAVRLSMHSRFFPRWLKSALASLFLTYWQMLA